MHTSTQDVLKILAPELQTQKAPKSASGAGFSNLMNDDGALAMMSKRAESRADKPGDRRPVDRSDDRRPERIADDGNEPVEETGSTSPAETADVPAETSDASPDATAGDDRTPSESRESAGEDTATAQDGADVAVDKAGDVSVDTAAEQSPTIETDAADILTRTGPNPAQQAQEQSTDPTGEATEQAAIQAAQAAPQQGPSLRNDRPTAEPTRSSGPASGALPTAGVPGQATNQANAQAQANAGGQNGAQQQSAQAQAQANQAQAAAALNQTGAAVPAAQTDKVIFNPAAWQRSLTQASGESQPQLHPTTGVGPGSKLLSGTANIATTRAAQQPPPPRQVTDQISVRISKALEDGTDRFTLQLKPATLGKVEVQMEIADGRLTAVVIADKPETLTLLQRDARGLEQALSDAGFDLGDGGLEFNLSDTGGRTHEEGEGSGAGNPMQHLLADGDDGDGDIDLDLQLLASDDPGITWTADGLDIRI